MEDVEAQQFALAFGEGFHGPEQLSETFFPDEFLVGRFTSRKVVGQFLGGREPADPVDAEVPHEQGAVGSRVPDDVQVVAHFPELHVQVLYGVQGIGPVFQQVEGHPVETVLQRNPDGMEPGVGHLSACFIRASTWSVRMVPRRKMSVSSARRAMSSSRVSSAEEVP